MGVRGEGVSALTIDHRHEAAGELRVVADVDDVVDALQHQLVLQAPSRHTHSRPVLTNNNSTDTPVLHHRIMCTAFICASI